MDLTKLMARRAEDIMLRLNDVLIVPSSEKGHIREFLDSLLAQDFDPC